MLEVGKQLHSSHLSTMKKTCTATSKLQDQVRKLKNDLGQKNNIIKRLFNNSKAEMNWTLKYYNKMISTLRSENNQLLTQIKNMEDGGTLGPMMDKTQLKYSSELQHLKDKAKVNRQAKHSHL
mmetsp:Transcript_34344/g.67558  ORF Transcript_34344/g.67558 Transcript_34344/m.67558 type:complete len:123 (+) Transcript_34344:523-891(+)